MRLAACALVIALAACHAGGRAAPSPPPITVSPSPSHVVLPEAQRLRDAARRTLAACPCAFDVYVQTYGGGPYFVSLTGVYDPSSRSIAYREQEEDDNRVGESRVVDGIVYTRVGAAWRRVDASGLPSPIRSNVALLALVDPGVFFAFGSGIDFAAPRPLDDDRFDVSYDIPTVVANAGPSGDLLRRLYPYGVAYDLVDVGQDGSLRGVSLLTSGGDQSVAMSVSYYVTALHQRATPVAAPPGSTSLKVT